MPPPVSEILHDVEKGVHYILALHDKALLQTIHLSEYLTENF